jgi:hypothetical protein
MEIKEHAPGRFCWAEVASTDQAAAKQFYASLLGWTHQDTPMPGGAYTMLFHAGAPIAGLYQLNPVHGVPPHWMVYVSVTSADETARKAEALGGKVLVPPFDAMEFGRRAVLQDPTGALFSIWEPRAHHGFGRSDEPGAPVWCELMTNDTDKAAAFYQELFGWERAPVPPLDGIAHSKFVQGDRGVGGMMPLRPDMGAASPSWTIYFAVEDCDRSAAKVVELGGTIRRPPTDIPGVGRFAVVADAQGAVMSIMKVFM